MGYSYLMHYVALVKHVTSFIGWHMMPMLHQLSNKSISTDIMHSIKQTTKCIRYGSRAGLLGRNDQIPHRMKSKQMAPKPPNEVMMILFHPL
jgi:hypothetical protein